MCGRHIHPSEHPTGLPWTQDPNDSILDDVRESQALFSSSVGWRQYRFHLPGHWDVMTVFLCNQYLQLHQMHLRFGGAILPPSQGGNRPPPRWGGSDHDTGGGIPRGGGGGARGGPTFDAKLGPHYDTTSSNW